MCKIIFSGLVDSMHGKLSGSVIQTTVGGPQLRAKVSPRNPRTGLQQYSRSRYSFYMRSWSNLTQVQRDTWIAGAPSGVPPASFFAGTNQMIHSAGGSFLNTYTDDPAPSLTKVEIYTLDPSTFEIAVSASFGIVPANNYIVILSTLEATPGITYLSPSSFSPLTAIPPATDLGLNYDITSAYTARYGTPKTDYLIGVQAYCIDITTGVCSNRVQVQEYVQPV